MRVNILVTVGNLSGNLPCLTHGILSLTLRLCLHTLTLLFYSKRYTLTRIQHPPRALSIAYFTDAYCAPVLQYHATCPLILFSLIFALKIVEVVVQTIW